MKSIMPISQLNTFNITFMLLEIQGLHMYNSIRKGGEDSVTSVSATAMGRGSGSVRPAGMTPFISDVVGGRSHRMIDLVWKECAFS